MKTRGWLIVNPGFILLSAGFRGKLARGEAVLNLP